MARTKKDAEPASPAPATSAPSVRPVQPAAPIGKPSSNTLTNILVGVFIVGVVGLIVASVLHRRGEDKGQKPTVELRYQPDMDRWQAVGDSIVYHFDVKKPFYQMAVDSLPPGGLLVIHAKGVYGFDSFIRRRTSDVTGPDGFQQKPEDMPRIQKPSRYALKSANIGALLGAFGEVVIDPNDPEHIPRVKGSAHFLVGSEQYVVVPGSLPTGKLHLMLNEPWLPGAWDDNWGRITVIISRYRPV